jgi:hypothetical protein
MKAGLHSTKPLSFANRKKVEKLRAMAEDLRRGKDYPITRLTSLKTLCCEPKVAGEFTAYLASISVARISRRKRPSHITKAKWEQFLSLAAEGWTSIKGHKSLKRLRDILKRVRASQCDIERHRWANVRVIQSRELLQVELALRCILEEPDAPRLAYQAGRNHAERYDSRYGTGLIPASADPLKEIVDFWAAAK